MKNQIFEIFGHLVHDKREEAEQNKKICTCPFYQGICDGGGNRNQSFIDRKTAKKNELNHYFNNDLPLIPTGVCSLVVNDTKWVVCPRRVFSFAQYSNNYHSQFVKCIIEKYCVLVPTGKIGVWSEVKVKYSENNLDDFKKSFDYTFDYIVASVAPKKLSEISNEFQISQENLLKQFYKAEIDISKHGNEYYVENYPVGNLNIVEIMTSSTSGGNKNNRTTIQQSFIDAIKGIEHQSPGINYRQVWARMVSQLIVKSQIAKRWNSVALWIVQDSLVDYISKSTDLNLGKLATNKPKDVNIVSLKYSQELDEQGCVKIMEENLYAGEIPKVENDTDFNRLLQAAIIPEMDVVKNKLIFRKPKTII